VFEQKQYHQAKQKNYRKDNATAVCGVAVVQTSTIGDREDPMKLGQTEIKKSSDGADSKPDDQNDYKNCQAMHESMLWNPQCQELPIK